MSTAKLNVWITNRADACHIDDQHQYYVHITDCHGKPLVWCNDKKPYTFLPAKCGHLEVEIPPGCYTVFASQSSEPPKDPAFQPFGNFLTHVQVVRANCGDHVCVTLFAPGMHYCGTWFQEALEAHAEIFRINNINADVVAKTKLAINDLLNTLQPEPYNLNVMDLIKQGPGGKK
jgi:hypothetical protein